MCRLRKWDSLFLVKWDMSHFILMSHFMLVQLQILTVLVVLWLSGKQRSSMVQAFSAENFQAESEEKENDAQS